MPLKSLLFRTLGMGLNLRSLIAPRASGRRAFELFTTAPSATIREKEKVFLATAMERRITRARQEIVEYHWGPVSGPLVVLSYGWGYNAGRWRHFVPQLVEAGMRVIAYDPPGHGQAPRARLSLADNAKIIENIIRSYGQAEVIMAHSFGAASALDGVFRLPRSLHPKRIVSMATFGDARQVFRKFQRGLGLWEWVYRRYVREIERDTGMTAREFDLAPRTGQLGHIQALLVHDPQDSVTPIIHAQRYHAYWPHSSLYLPLGVGHHLGSARVTEAVLNFAMSGRIPETATIQERPLAAHHDLVRYFAGMEV